LVLLAPIRPALIAATALVLADLVCGVWASIKEKKKITSNGFRRTVNKILGYYLAIIAAFILETYLLPDMPILKGVTALIGLTEGKSLFENIDRITGINFWGFIQSKLNMDDIKNPKDDSEK
jgi:phage-related holin